MRQLLLLWVAVIGVSLTLSAQPNQEPLTASAAPYDYKDMSTPTNYVGIGVVVQKDMETTWMYVQKVLKKGPAQKAGLQKGDFITRIDGQPTMKMKLEDLAGILIGEEGTSVDLVVMRDHAFFDLTITRSPIIF